MDKLAIRGGKPVRESKIFYGHQYIDDEDIQEVVKVLRGEYLTCGPKIKELENTLCTITGSEYAVAVSNGTAALHVACLAAGITEGDEVITTPLTFAASANCILYCGAKPVFADVNIDTYLIKPEEIKSKITSKTKAVIVVDYTGQAVELNTIRKICDENNLIMIEDAAHSIGTRYDGKEIGSIADFTTFSFHPVKTVTGGEGGAVLTNKKKWYEKMTLFRSHGITHDLDKMQNICHGDWYYEQIELGYNYRITDIQAALIISQLKKLNLFKKRRSEITEMYNSAFSKMEEIILQQESDKSDTARHLYIIQLNFDRLKGSRREIFDALKKENVCCNVHYIPIYYFPYYKKLGYKKGLCPNAEKIYESIISIPLYYSMTDEDVESVICAIKKVISFYRLQ